MKKKKNQLNKLNQLLLMKYVMILENILKYSLLQFVKIMMKQWEILIRIKMLKGKKEELF